MVLAVVKSVIASAGNPEPLPHRGAGGLQHQRAGEIKNIIILKVWFRCISKLDQKNASFFFSEAIRFHGPKSNILYEIQKLPI